jgi:hypothetical protein
MPRDVSFPRIFQLHIKLKGEETLGTRKASAAGSWRTSKISQCDWERRGLRAFECGGCIVFHGGFVNFRDGVVAESDSPWGLLLFRIWGVSKAFTIPYCHKTEISNRSVPNTMVRLLSALLSFVTHKAHFPCIFKMFRKASPFNCNNGPRLESCYLWLRLQLAVDSHGL